MKQTTVEKKRHRLKQEGWWWRQWGKLPRSPQLPSSVSYCRLGPGVGQAVHQARGWERRDKGRVQLSVLSDYVSPVPGSDGPNPELETMWVTAHPPGNKGMWQGGAGLWLRGLGLGELPARCVESPLRLPDWLPPVRVEAGVPTSVQALRRHQRRALKLSRVLSLLVFGDTNTIIIAATLPEQYAEAQGSVHLIFFKPHLTLSASLIRRENGLVGMKQLAWGHTGCKWQRFRRLDL